MSDTNDPVLVPGEAVQRPRSLILTVIGVLFVGFGLWWTPSFATVVRDGTLATFVGARTAGYVVTYLLAGIGMILHARWAVFAAAAWALLSFSQSIYPPIPRERVPLLAQVAIALISAVWMLGLVFFTYRKTRARTVQ